MSENEVAAGAAQQVAGDGVTAGMLLRQAREAAGLHVAALAVALKVPVRKLEALEDNRFDLLTDAVFVRALASSVCRTLKIDPQPVLERMPQTTAPRLVNASDGINAPFRAPSDGAGPSWIDQMSKPVFLAVFALLLGALVLIFLPAMRDEAAPDEKAQAVAMSEPVPVVVPAAAPTPAPAPAAVASAVAPAPVVMAATVTRATPAAVSPTVSAPTIASPTAVVTAQTTAAKAASATVVTPTPTPTPTPAAGGTVVFKTSGESWISVTDAKGVSVLRRMMVAGETAGASGALPLTVTVGRVSATEVQVRGQAFDLGAVARDNVARFEVK